jgi:very-short-patch-repair endonuclease
MIKKFYNRNLVPVSRYLRSNLTKAESVLWYHIRDEQTFGVKFYLQSVVCNYIVDFYAPNIKLIIEVDGSQHFEPIQAELDRKRDEDLASFGILVLRYNNRQVLLELTGVLHDLYEVVQDRLSFI